MGRRASPVATGSIDERSVEDLLDRTQAEFGWLDFLVNNAASSRGNDCVPVIEMPVAEWDRVIGINLRGRFLMSRAFVQRMVANNWPGCIITISSVAGKSLPPRGGIRCLVYDIQVFAAGMAVEPGPSSVRVNTLYPGFVDTSCMDQPNVSHEYRVRAAAERSPLRRMREGDEIGTACAFFCSEQGDWINGQAINVNGRLIRRALMTALWPCSMPCGLIREALSALAQIAQLQT